MSQTYNCYSQQFPYYTHLAFDGMCPVLVLSHSQGCSPSASSRAHQPSLALSTSSLPSFTPIGPVYIPSAPVPAAFSKDYILRFRLGKGTFSEVVCGESKHTRERLAVKIIRKPNCGGLITEKELASELSVLQVVKHPNLIALRQVFHTNSHVFIITELAAGGELFERIEAQGPFEEHEAARIMTMVLSAVAYLHDHNIAHRDLKPENILFEHKGPDSKIVVADFGLSKMAPTGCELVLKTTCGSVEYLAPEIVLGEAYTIAVDLWSLGVITYIMLCAYSPFFDDNRNVMFRRIVEADFVFQAKV